jgi:hypothetical protein
MDCGKVISFHAKRCRGCSNRFSKTGVPNPKVSKSKLGNLNPAKRLSVRAKISANRKGKRSGAEHPMYGIHRWGSSSPNWKGGISFAPYDSAFNKALRALIRERDKYTCMVCGKTQELNRKQLDVHHINYDKQDISLTNLISLCITCHRKTNGNREYWKRYFGRNICWEHNLVPEIDIVVRLLDELNIKHTLTNLGDALSNNLRNKKYAIRKLEYADRAIIEQMVHHTNSSICDVILSFRYKSDDLPSNWELEVTIDDKGQTDE